MQAAGVRDLTVGKPLSVIILFTIPILIGNVFQQLYSAVDTIVIGQTLGAEALAGVGSIGSIQFLVFSLASGLGQGMTVLTAQFVGAKDEERTRKSISVIYVSGIVMALSMTVLGLVLLPALLDLLKIPPEIRARAYAYQSVIFAGLIGTLSYNILSSIIRALGDSRTPLYFLILSSVLNIFGDLWFITGLRMDVEGAALATVLSQLISGVLCFFYGVRCYDVMRPTRESLSFSAAFLWEHVRTGVPISVQNSITGIGMMVFQRVLNDMGATSIAAYTACDLVSRLKKRGAFAVMPMFALANALVTFTAQNWGAKRYDRIREGVRKTWFAELAISLVLACGTILACRLLVSVFIGDATEEIHRLSRSYVVGQGIGMWAGAMLFTYRAAVQGCGYTKIPMLGGFMELLMRVFAALVLAPRLGMFGLGVASPLAWIGAAVLNVGFYFAVPDRKGREAAHSA